MSICLLYCLFFSFLSVFLFFSSLYFIISGSLYFLEFDILFINGSSIVFTVLLDWISLMFMSFVLLISSMVIMYSEEYMMGDLNIDRFILLVVLFVVSMMMMILSPNMISILLGWDGLGLVSYCLVIYYQNVKSYNAGMLTVLSNRVGDVAILLSIAWLVNYGSWSFLHYLDFMFDDFTMFMVSSLVVLAAFTKSAQIPFSSWLPAAMAAPTPVSSLVHSSTLVTAGVYLLIRFSNGLGPGLCYLGLLLAMMTMFMAGLGANFEFDLKKIIALSTLSQLGLMMSILFLGSSDLAFFHLLTHALFKALLFMCAGNVIHSLGNCQDIRYMGSLVNQMPLTISFFCISNLSLCGLPFLSGFYSKDLVLEVFSMGHFNIFVYVVFFLSVGFTVSYTFRLMYYTLFGVFNYSSFNMLSDEGWIMLKGMLGMIFFVIMWGSVLSWLMFPVPYFICLPLLLKLMSLVCILSGALLGVESAKFFLNYSSWSLSFPFLSFFFSTMWNLPTLSTLGVNYVPLYLGKVYLKVFDQGWSEHLGSQGLYNGLKDSSRFLQLLFNNSLKVFLSVFIIWILFLYLV
uniref:NADH-ubiquinone oxidoreductase chain 5 n=1 Tax=Apatides fortis TaxID=590156 RepID=D1G5P2_APAFO|nr:NADH dehydrogenase subunit 5 [Apatides fortis]ACM45057.1 NADH dehydrogenase subunit 5 [Apatides fortis]